MSTHYFRQSLEAMLFKSVLQPGDVIIVIKLD